MNSWRKNKINICYKMLFFTSKHLLFICVQSLPNISLMIYSFPDLTESEGAYVTIFIRERLPRGIFYSERYFVRNCVTLIKWPHGRIEKMSQSNKQTNMLSIMTVYFFLPKKRNCTRILL